MAAQLGGCLIELRRHLWTVIQLVPGRSVKNISAHRRGRKSEKQSPSCEEFTRVEAEVLVVAQLRPRTTLSPECVRYKFRQVL
jgi:hypothetical protein